MGRIVRSIRLTYVRTHTENMANYVAAVAFGAETAAAAAAAAAVAAVADNGLSARGYHNIILYIIEKCVPV